MIALQIVKLLIKHPEVHVVSDGRRIFEAFAEAWHLPAHEVASVEHLIYLNDATVIFLHTGARSDAQHERYQKFLKVAKGNPFLDFYHVGRWFV